MASYAVTQSVVWCVSLSVVPRASFSGRPVTAHWSPSSRRRAREQSERRGQERDCVICGQTRCQRERPAHRGTESRQLGAATLRRRARPAAAADDDTGTSAPTARERRRRRHGNVGADGGQLMAHRQRRRARRRRATGIRNGRYR